MSITRSQSRPWSSLLCVVASFLTMTAAWAGNADRQALEEQVRRFWTAELKRDYEAVYEVLGVAERSASTREDYVKKRTEKGPYTFLAADIKEIAVAGKVAWVNVKFDYTLTRYAGYPTRTLERWQVWRYADAWYPITPDEYNQFPTLPPHLRPAKDEAELTQRVNALWQAKIEQDWKMLYQYLSPAYRARVPLDQFLAKKAEFLYVSANVEWVEASGDQARARIDFSYKLNERAASKMKPLEEMAIERWIRVAGEWYLDANVPEPPKETARKDGT